MRAPSRLPRRGADAGFGHGQPAVAFGHLLAEDVCFRFGNAPPVAGRAAAAGTVRDFLGSIAGLQHQLPESWNEGDTTICHGTVTYARHDGSALTVPFANVLKVGGRLVRECLIFVDASGLHGER